MAITDKAEPVKRGKEPVIDRVLRDLAYRSLQGEKKYGTPLMTENGRNALQDAYEEALDLCMYLGQAVMEAESRRIRTQPLIINRANNDSEDDAC